jgi:hypothetical protein
VIDGKEGRRHLIAPQNMPSIPAEAALSFLKDTSRFAIWRTLWRSAAVMPNTSSPLAAQGYVQREDKGEWMTTPAGESVSGLRREAPALHT